MLNAEQEDVLRELVNIGIGRAAYTLSEMVDCSIGLRVPRVYAEPDVPASDGSARRQPASSVTQSFSGGVTGSASLDISLESARRLVAVLTNTANESDEIDAEREAVITEVGNIVINAVLGSLGNLAALDLVFGLPRYEETGHGERSMAARKGSVIRIGVLFQIQSYAIEGELSVTFDIPSLSGVWAAVLDPDMPGQVGA